MTSTPTSRHLVLVGFMATGKSTVGRLLAAALDRPFVDLDEHIEARAAAPISAIFAEQGEAAFRRLEAEILAEILAGEHAAVIATGGGAVGSPESIALMRSRGLVIALTAPLEVIRARVPDTGSRPLLRRSDAEIQALYQQRLPLYGQAHACVRTEGETPDAVARVIAGILTATAAIPGDALAGASLVALAERTYPVITTAGSLSRAGELIRALSPGVTRAGVVTDSNVAPHYSETVRHALAAAGIDSCEIVVPAGEGAKCFAELARLCEALVEGGLDRRSIVVALGGGVIGDLAGFAAASLFRGIACAQLPTTILAMVDSAIGGKTGINIAAGKNLVGAFWQPRLVLADPRVLTSLPLRERRAALGELVKYALLDGDDLYAALEAAAPLIAAQELAEPDSLAEVIRRAVAIKSFIVTRDEREQTGERALLNLGHTVGHAIEAAAGYGTLLHGEAVALGLIAACRLSARLGLADAALETRVTATLARAGLDTALDPWLRPDVLDRIGVDKKRTGKVVAFVTVSRPGACTLTPLSVEELSRTLRA